MNPFQTGGHGLASGDSHALGHNAKTDLTATQLWQMLRVVDGRKWPQPRGGWEFFADADPG